MQDGVQEEDTRGRRLRKDARRAAGKEQQKRRVGEDAGQGAGRRHPSRRLGEDSKKERNEGTHVNKLSGNKKYRPEGQSQKSRGIKGRRD